MPHALVVDDDTDTREMHSRMVAGEGYSVAAAESLGAARASIARRMPDVVLVDLELPDGEGIALVREIERSSTTDVIVVTGHATLDTAIAALRLGASDYLTKPINVERLVQLLHRRPRAAEPDQQIAELRDELRQVGRFGHLIGNSAEMHELYDRIRCIAPTSAPVLVLGERGSGKELIARTIHALSRRRSGPYFVFDCSAPPSHQIDAELFGREAGIGGRQHQRSGVLERANDGTVLLSSVTFLPVAVQVKLLRFLDSGDFMPAGGATTRTADVRVIAASVATEGQFCDDVLQRLEVFPIHVPPLRQRGGDVRLLAQRFLDELNQAEGTGKRFSIAALARLQAHRWPGNVRELKNYVHRAYLHAGSVIDGGESAAEVFAEDMDDLITFRIGTPLEEVDRRVTIATLAKCGGVKKLAAATLGISLKTLYNRLEAYGEKHARRNAASARSKGRGS